ncbi:hypothetical protein [Effusibacillus pohliae]|uniref:hypothetical protein n=1 Tax=Effusibacillus pohliae TaxID=232270 RepID=UPI000366DD16|nr:hypothetical protein [Effusibacillus pohliae]
MNSYQSVPKFSAGYPTFVMAVLAFLYGIFPLAGYFLYLKSPNAFKTFGSLPLADFQYPEKWVTGTVVFLIILYVLWLKKIPNAWVWFHTYVITTITSCAVIWIHEQRLPVHVSFSLPIHIPVSFQIAALIVLRALYVRKAFEPREQGQRGSLQQSET